jgi:hypothetical protein
MHHYLVRAGAAIASVTITLGLFQSVALLAEPRHTESQVAQAHAPAATAPEATTAQR